MRLYTSIYLVIELVLSKRAWPATVHCCEQSILESASNDNHIAIDYHAIPMPPSWVVRTVQKIRLPAMFAIDLLPISVFAVNVVHGMHRYPSERSCYWRGRAHSNVPMKERLPNELHEYGFRTTTNDEVRHTRQTILMVLSSMNCLPNPTQSDWTILQNFLLIYRLNKKRRKKIKIKLIKWHEWINVNHTQFLLQMCHICMLQGDNRLKMSMDLIFEFNFKYSQVNCIEKTIEYFSNVRVRKRETTFIWKSDSLSATMETNLLKFYTKVKLWNIIHQWSIDTIRLRAN